MADKEMAELAAGMTDDDLTEIRSNLGHGDSQAPLTPLQRAVIVELEKRDIDLRA